MPQTLADTFANMDPETGRLRKGISANLDQLQGRIDAVMSSAMRTGMSELSSKLSAGKG